MLISIKPDRYDAVLPSVRCNKATADAIRKIAEEKDVHSSVVIRVALEFFLQNYVNQISINAVNMEKTEAKSS